MDRDVKPALFQAEAQVHCNGIAESRLGLGVEAALKNSAVWGSALGLDVLYEGHQSLSHLQKGRQQSLPASNASFMDVMSYASARHLAVNTQDSIDCPDRIKEQCTVTDGHKAHR